jgi:release factor glutamine methyltransferase
MKFEDKVKILREKKHNGRETKDFLQDVIRVANGEAYEYLLGEVLFCGVKVDLSYKPMIPRPETEFWVRQALEEIAGQNDSKVLDLFCGSGCIGLSVLKAQPNSFVTFTDIVSTTDKQVQISCEKNKISKERYEVIVSDCELFFKNSKKKYDVIFAVPPYVPRSMCDEVMEELHAEEPVFFFDKEEGMYYITKLLEVAKHLLNPNGILFMEFDGTQEEQIKNYCKQQKSVECSFFSDPYGHTCAVKMLVL